MSKEIIAVIRLNYGEVGYYDDLSHIHLTASDPQRDILAGTNCTQLRRSVKSRRLRLLAGSLGESQKIELNKRGNKFIGEEAVMPAEAPAPVVIKPMIPEIESILTPEVEIAPIAPIQEVVIPAEESGVVDIIPAQLEAPIVEEVAEVAVDEETEVAAEAVEEEAKKNKRKPKANQ